MGLTGLCVGQLPVLHSRASEGATQTGAFICAKGMGASEVIREEGHLGWIHNLHVCSRYFLYLGNES